MNFVEIHICNKIYFVKSNREFMGHPIRLDITQNVICHPSESVVYNAADGTFPLRKAIYKYKAAIYSVHESRPFHYDLCHRNN